MKKVAFVFVLAVLLPSLVLAWLAVRSLRDQQFLLERQQSLLCQRVTDALAQNVSDYLAQQQQTFGAQVENLAAGGDARALAVRFDSELRSRWPLAEVGFCVTLSGRILSPSLDARAEARTFYTDNSGFLGNREAVEVYGNNDSLAKNTIQNFERSAANQPVSVNGSVNGFGSYAPGQKQSLQQVPAPAPPAVAPVAMQTLAAGSQEKLKSSAPAPARKDDLAGAAFQSGSPNQSSVQSVNYLSAQTRKVSPQSSAYQLADKIQVGADNESQANLSRVVPAEAEFGQLIGNGTDGMLARFLQNKLRLIFWHRLSTEPDLIFGAQLNLDRVVDALRGLVQADTEMHDEICLAISTTTPNR